MSAFTLRAATAADIPKLVELAVRYVSEAAPGFPPVDREILTAQFAADIANIALADKGEGVIAGVIWLRRKQYWWSAQELLAEQLFYVAPEHRANGVAKDLAQFAKLVALENKLPLTMGHMSGIDVDRKDAWYGRALGMTRIGGIFAYNWDAAGASGD